MTYIVYDHKVTDYLRKKLAESEWQPEQWLKDLEKITACQEISLGEQTDIPASWLTQTAAIQKSMIWCLCREGKIAGASLKIVGPQKQWFVPLKEARALATWRSSHVPLFAIAALLKESGFSGDIRFLQRLIRKKGYRLKCYSFWEGEKVKFWSLHFSDLVDLLRELKERKDVSAEWLSCEMAAGALGIKKSTVYKWLKKKIISGRRLPFESRDGAIYISRTEVERVRRIKLPAVDKNSHLRQARENLRSWAAEQKIAEKVLEQSVNRLTDLPWSDEKQWWIAALAGQKEIWQKLKTLYQPFLAKLAARHWPGHFNQDTFAPMSDEFMEAVIRRMPILPDKPGLTGRDYVRLCFQLHLKDLKKQP